MRTAHRGDLRGSRQGPVPRLTVSKVAVPRTPALWLVMAIPARTVVGRAMVWEEPAMSGQVTPSGLV